MRLSAVISALFHATIIGLAMTTFAKRAQFDLEVPENIPVELLTLADITNVSAAIAEENVPEAVEEEIMEEAEPESEPEPQQVAALPDPVLELPEPEAEFLPDDSTPEPEPEIIEAEPEPEPVPPPAPTVRPRVRPEPPERREEFDFAAAEALIDLTPEEEETAFSLEDLQIGDEQQVQTAERSRQAVGLGTGLTISQTDALRAAISDCWVPPAGAVNAENLQIELRVRFNPDATVRDVDIIDFLRYNSDNFYKAAADSARRAVRQCENGTRFDGSYRQGYDLPRDQYDTWRTVRLTFDPSNMF